MEVNNKVKTNYIEENRGERAIKVHPNYTEVNRGKRAIANALKAIVVAAAITTLKGVDGKENSTRLDNNSVKNNEFSWDIFFYTGPGIFALVAGAVGSLAVLCCVGACLKECAMLPFQSKSSQNEASSEVPDLESTESREESDLSEGPTLVVQSNSEDECLNTENSSGLDQV